MVKLLLFLISIFCFQISYAQNLDSIQSEYTTQTLPEPYKGIIEFRKYIGKNFFFTKEMIKAKLTGNIICKFIVETDRSLTNIEVIKDLGHETKEEAIRMLNTYTAKYKWTPGMQNGEAVRVEFTLPIKINLQ